MSKAPRRRSEEAKLKIAIEAIKGEKTIIQIAAENSLHPRQITRWRNKLLQEAKEIFIHKSTQKTSDQEVKELLSTIERLNKDLEFLKKKLSTSL